MLIAFGNAPFTNVHARLHGVGVSNFAAAAQLRATVAAVSDRRKTPGQPHCAAILGKRGQSRVVGETGSTGDGALPRLDK